MNIDGLNEFSTALIIAAIAWAVPQILKAASDAWQLFKDAQPASAYQIEEAVEKGVRLAEQTGFVGGVKKSSVEKLNIAVDFASAWLKQTSGINVNRDLVVQAVEAAVNELFPKTK